MQTQMCSRPDRNGLALMTRPSSISQCGAAGRAEETFWGEKAGMKPTRSGFHGAQTNEREKHKGRRLAKVGSGSCGSAAAKIGLHLKCTHGEEEDEEETLKWSSAPSSCFCSETFNSPSSLDEQQL